MMNIAIIIPTLMSGGAEKQSLYLAKELSKKYNVYLIVLKKHMIEQKLLNIIENTNVNKVFLSGNLIKNMINIYSEMGLFDINTFKSTFDPLFKIKNFSGSMFKLILVLNI